MTLTKWIDDIVYSLNESSSGYLISRANMDTMIAAFEAIEARHKWHGTEEDGGACFSHEFYGGAFERGEWLFINPACVEGVTEAEAMTARLADYPILDEEYLGQLEFQAIYSTARDAMSDLSGYGYENPEAEQAAPFVVEHANEAGRDPFNTDPEQWYPDRRDLFWGLIGYRRSLRTETSA